MQYKQVNDRELKEWVGSAIVIENENAPRKTVKAGHIFDKYGNVHKLFMNDYIVKVEEGNELTFVILSESVFNTLFRHMDESDE